MQTVASGGVWEGDFVARTRSGSRIDVHVVDAPVFGVTGEIEGIVGISSLALRSAHSAIVEIAELMEYQRVGVQAVERERQRIARELHDDLGQVLTALRTEVLWLRSRSDAIATESADRIASSVATALDSVRRIVDELHPRLLEQLGVCAAVEAMAEDFGSRLALDVEVVIDHAGLGWLHHEVEMAVFRVTQECLTNIERHATGVSHVMVEMVHEIPDVGTPGDFVLRVSNDGVPYNGARGFGIRSMMDRAASVGGRAAVISTPGGAMVEVRVPAVLAFTDRPTDTPSVVRE
jgi:signal transduction histidine kinase